MPTYNLAAEARRARNIRRPYIVLKDIAGPAMLATDLFNAVYKPTIQLWTEAAPRIVDEYARTLSTMTSDAPADIQREIDGAEQAFNRLFLTLTPSLRDWALKVERAVRTRWTRQVFSATSVDLSTRLGPSDVTETLETIIGRNAALVKDVSQQIQARISDSVYRGLTARTPARDVAKEINEAVGLGRKRALRVASDQLSKASGTLAEERQRQAGITQVIWVSSHKRNPRPHHAARDGKRYYLDSKKAVDGSETVAPGDWVSQPPFCGCRTRSYIDFSDE
jgi:SPP1 gp7 family putative phage head morphogenesis protein